jgi:hypothetical protein
MSTLRNHILCAGGLVAALALGASPAGAEIVTGPAGTLSLNRQTPTNVVSSPVGLTYQGGPVMHANQTYLFFWSPPQGPTQVANYPLQSKVLIQQYLQDVGAASGGTMPESGPNQYVANVDWVTSQYADGSGNASYASTYRGSYTDGNPYPASGCTDPGGASACLTDAQIQFELRTRIAQAGLPAGSTEQYFVMLPPGVAVCSDGTATDCSDGTTNATSFCSYHSFITSSPVPTIYAVIPWVDPQDLSTLATANAACEGTHIQEPNNPMMTDPNKTPLWGDMEIDQLSAMHNAMSSDPQPSLAGSGAGWWDTADQDQASRCSANFYLPTSELQDYGKNHAWNQNVNGHNYWVQDEYNNGEPYPYAGVPGLTPQPPSPYTGDQFSCIGGPDYYPQVVAPNPVKPGDQVAFDGTSTYDSLGIEAGSPTVTSKYVWNFGDGTPHVANPSVFHSFTTPGTYTVTLSVTDDGGNVGSVSEQITVLGTPPGGAGGSGSGSGASTTNAGSTSTPGSGHGAAGAAPAATVAVGSPSTTTIVHKGLFVRYTVSKPAAGHVQLVLDAATARRLGIRGPHPMVGATSLGKGAIVIGSAVLVAAKAGQGQLTIKLTQTAAKHLRRAHHVRATLVMSVTDSSLQRTVLAKQVVLR